MTHKHYAFPDDIEIEAVMRFASIRRWHMLDLTRVQTLAEHSANVGLLAYTIAMRAPDMYFGPAAHVAAYGLLHDVGEVFVGDMPTPTKKEFGPAIDNLERALTPFNMFMDVSREVRLLVKICDIADGIRYLTQHSVGAIRDHAIQGLKDQFASRFLMAMRAWPMQVAELVIDKAQLYAYEFRDIAASRLVYPYAKQMDPDLARGSGSVPGGPGRELRDEGTGPRDRMVGTEGPNPLKFGGTD
jgi:hypothetical protein